MRHHIFPTLAAAAAAAALAAAPTAVAEDIETPPSVMVKASSPEAAEAIAASHGLTVKRGFAWIDWYELATPAGTASAASVQAELDEDPKVVATDTVHPSEDFGPTFTPRDPVWTPNLTIPTGEHGAWGMTKVSLPAAWDITTGAGALIGIIDSEFDTTHPELAPKIRDPYNASFGTPGYKTANVNAVGESPNVIHGTHVAGTAVATGDNNKGVTGAAFDANLVPVRVKTSFESGTGRPVDAGFVADLTEGLGYLQGKGIGVVNLSLGGTRHHQPMQDAINALRASGVTIVAAAGNFQDQSPSAPIYPASYPGVIAVANTRVNDTINPTSSNGSWVDIAAPGTNIMSTWPTWNNDDGRGNPLFFPGETDVNHRYGVLSGTSMAAPLVTGIVGLMKAARPDLTPDEVESLIKSTARDLGSAGADPQFGQGLIDAAAAVAAARAYVRPAPPAPPAPPAGDTAAPGLTIRGAFELKGSRAITVRFLCSEGCSGTVRVFAAKGKTKKGKRYASKSFVGLPGKRITVKLNSSTKLRKGAKVVVQVQVKDAIGNTATQEFRKSLK